MRFTKDDALMLEATKPKKTPLLSGGWFKIHKDGSKRWYSNKGKLHRLDGPAIVEVDGSKHWYVDGVCHRVGGPAIERVLGGTEVWCVNGKRHRLDGPAVEYTEDGSKEWWVNGQQHRLDGPAVERVDGDNEWWVNDKEYSEEEFNKLYGRYKDLADRRVVADMDTMFG